MLLRRLAFHEVIFHFICSLVTNNFIWKLNLLLFCNQILPVSSFAERLFNFIRPGIMGIYSMKSILYTFPATDTLKNIYVLFTLGTKTQQQLISQSIFRNLWQFRDLAVKFLRTDRFNLAFLIVGMDICIDIDNFLHV